MYVKNTVGIIDWKSKPILTQMSVVKRFLQIKLNS